MSGCSAISSRSASSASAVRRPAPDTHGRVGVVGAQYYWILHYHPVALLGWIGLLEGYPPAPEMLDELMARTGLRGRRRSGR